MLHCVPLTKLGRECFGREQFGVVPRMGSKEFHIFLFFMGMVRDWYFTAVKERLKRSLEGQCLHFCSACPGIRANP